MRDNEKNVNSFRSIRLIHFIFRNNQYNDQGFPFHPLKIINIKPFVIYILVTYTKTLNIGIFMLVCIHELDMYSSQGKKKLFGVGTKNNIFLFLFYYQYIQFVRSHPQEQFRNLVCNWNNDMNELVFKFTDELAIQLAMSLEKLMNELMSFCVNMSLKKHLLFSQ